MRQLIIDVEQGKICEARIGTFKEELSHKDAVIEVQKESITLLSDTLNKRTEQVNLHIDKYAHSQQELSKNKRLTRTLGAIIILELITIIALK